MALERRLIAGAAVAACCALSVMLAKGFQKVESTQAPPFRQKGEPSSRVVIVEFSDFQCPHCRVGQAALKELLALYGKEVRVTYKHYPLSMHAWAKPAAVAAECAGRQGKFWPYHDALYERQEQWSLGQDAALWLSKYAQEFKLNIKSFEACLKDPAAAAAVETDIKEGNLRWVSSTPTFFINNKRFAGSRQLASRGPLWIDKILKK
ncbi:MAG: DsbA family protein [Elusimicrobia bacterium]|nr:DsbA family protein [Elusimicrobiota bacterium]